MAPIDYLLTRVGGWRVALPLDLVLAVSETANVTPLPFAPAGVGGLVFVLDRVMPQLDLAGMLGQRAGAGEGSLVIAAVGDDIRALRVDRVEAMVAMAPEALVPLPVEQRKHRLLTDQFRHGEQDWQVLDYVHFLRESSLAAEGLVEDAALLPVESGPVAVDSLAEADGENTHTACLLVTIAGDTYAVATADIAEILVTSDLRFMPGAPAYVPGLIDRRGTPLLTLDTARLLGKGGGGELATMLVIEPADAPPYALAVGKALGIARIPDEQIFALDAAMAGVGRYTVMEDGRIVGIVSPADLIAQVGAEIRRCSPTALVAPLAEAPAVEETVRTHRLLALRLADNDFAIDLERVEAILAAVVLTPLPGDGNGFDGLADAGDKVVPVKDLRRVFAGPLAEAPPCVLLQLEGSLAGIAVDQVLRIEDVPDSAITPVVDRRTLPVHAIASIGDRLLAVLTVDRLLPPLLRPASASP